MTNLQSSWSPGWSSTLFVALMLPIVIALGIWQLHRAAEKHGYQDAYFDRMAETPMHPLASGGLDAFRRVSLIGRFDPVRYFLVDNQTHDGLAGYWIIAVLVEDDGRRWLVNAGWVVAPLDRVRLPEVNFPAGVQSVTGVVWPEMGLVPLLAADPWPDAWPKRVQRLDVVAMAALVAATRAVEIRLDPGTRGVAIAAPQGRDFKASRHEGYAVQWFGLGAVLLVSYLIYGFKRHA